MRDSDFCSLTTLVLDAGPLADVATAIEQLVAHRQEALIVSAGRMMHVRHITDPAFGADDALQNACVAIWKAVQDGKIAPVDREDDVGKLLWHKLEQTVLHQRAREDTQKRRGSRDVQADDRQANPQREDELDVIDSHSMQPVQQAIAEEAVEQLLKLLDRHGASLRVIAIMKANGFSHREIAAELGIGLSTVEHRVRLIRSILERP
jgi:RNA polymerase sigma factor (sigma-70 family)